MINVFHNIMLPLSAVVEWFEWSSIKLK